MAKAKALSLTNINKDVKVLSEQFDGEVVSSVTGDTYTIKVDKHIAKTKVMSLISEIMTELQEARQKEIRLQDVFVQYCILQFIKHFTSLGKDIPSDLDGKLQVLRKLIDLDLINPIFELFDEDEVSEVFETINDTIQSTGSQVESIARKVVAINEAFEAGKGIDEIQDLLEDGDELTEAVEEE